SIFLISKSCSYQVDARSLDCFWQQVHELITAGINDRCRAKVTHVSHDISHEKDHSFFDIDSILTAVGFIAIENQALHTDDGRTSQDQRVSIWIRKICVIWPEHFLHSLCAKHATAVSADSR